MSFHVSSLVTLNVSGPGPSSGGWGMTPSPGAPDANMMMQQIQQLQKTVMELSAGQSKGYGGDSNGNSGAMGGGYRTNYGGSMPGTQGNSNYRTWSNNREDSGSNMKEGDDESILDGEQKVLLVSNIPPNLANPDSLFYAFEKFGTVERVKVLHNKRNTALIQMSSPDEANRACNEQDKLNRVGTDIYVNFSSKFKEIRIPTPGSMYDDGLTKDFTGQFPSQPHMSGPNNFNSSQGFDNMGGGMYGGMNNMGGRNNFNMGSQDYGFNNYGEMGRGNHSGGVVLLVSNIPEEIANVDAIFNMLGMYGDVLAVKILRNKRDCCLVHMAKPHHAQQVRNYLDQAKVGGKKLCISHSRVDTLLNKRIADDMKELHVDFSNSRNHRYRNHQMAAKLTKNLGPPSSTLHVANLPEDFSHSDVKDMFIEKGFTVKESKECGTGGNMALLTMASPDEALMALAMMHNYAPEEYKFKNVAGLCVSFSGKK